MTKRSRVVRAFLALVLFGSMVATTSGQNRGSSVYEQLDPSQLATVLRQLEMTEFLDQLGSELGQGPKTIKSMLLSAELQIAKASRLPQKAYNEEMAKIIKQLEETVETFEEQQLSRDKIKAAKTRLDQFKVRAKLADLVCRVSIERQADQIMIWLQGTEQDRKAILKKTDQGLGQWDDLLDDMDTEIQDSRGDIGVWVVMGDALTQFRSNSQYLACWGYLYRSMALSKADKEQDSERQQLLEDLLLLVKPFAEGSLDEVGERKYWALWMAGVAYRELGEMEKAQKILSPVIYSKTDANLREIIEVERIVTLVKEGKFPQAQTAAAKLPRTLTAILGPKAALKVDIRAAVVNRYLYQQWAAASKTAADRKKYLLEGQKSLLALIEKHTDPAVQQALMGFIARQHIEQGTPAGNLGALELLAVARHNIAQGEQKLDIGEEQVKGLLARDDDVAKLVKPQALWEMAMVMNGRKRNKEASDYFLRIAKEYPNDRLAAKAADYASRSLIAVVRQNERAGKVSSSLRETAVAAMDLAVSFAGKSPAMDLNSWYYTIGDQCDKLAAGTVGKTQADWTAKAIQAFDRVPAKPEGRKFDARNMALNLRYRQLRNMGKGPQVTTQASSLRGDFQKFSQETNAASASATDKADVTALKGYAAWADFYAIRIQAEQLDQTAKGLAELKQLPSRWPGSDMLVAAKQYEIQIMVETGRVDEAIAQLDAYRSKHGEQVSQLIDMVIGEIRDGIERLEDQGGQEERIAMYRKAYLRFSRQLFANVKGLPLKDRQDETLLFVDALNQNGQGDKALELVLQIDKLEKAQRQAKSEQYEKDYAPRFAAVDAAAGDAKKLGGLLAEFVKHAKNNGYDVDVEFGTLLSAQAMLAEADPESDRYQRLVSNLSRQLKDAYQICLRDMKNTIPERMDVLVNLARSYAASGKYDQAVNAYTRITQGLGGATGKRQSLFWRLELELCKMVLDGFGDNKEWMNTLTLRINQLRTRDKNMGGLSDKFYAIESVAKKQSE